MTCIKSSDPRCGTQCPECGGTKYAYSMRCRSCAERHRWWNPTKFLPEERPSPEAVAYAAGFYEGEGYCSYHQGSFRVAFTQKDLQPLRMVRRWFGGSLLGPKKDGCYYLVIQGKLAWDFVVATEMYLSDRRISQLVEAVKQVRCLDGIWEGVLSSGPWTDSAMAG